MAVVDREFDSHSQEVEGPGEFGKGVLLSLIDIQGKEQESSGDTAGRKVDVLYELSSFPRLTETPSPASVTCLLRQKAAENRSKYRSDTPGATDPPLINSALM